MAGDPSTDTVAAATERMLSMMPADFFTIRPVPASQEIEGGSSLVLDVRESNEFSVDRIAGAKNVPLRSFVASMADLPDDRSIPVLVYCKSGHRGAMATTILHMYGYSDVRSIYGGLDGWKAAGLPVVMQ